MKKIFTLIIFFIFSSMISATTINTKYTEARLLLDQKSYGPNQTIWAMLTLTHKEGWYSYWKNPGDSGLKTNINWTIPDGFDLGEPLWPVPQKFTAENLINFGYKQGVNIVTPLVISDKLVDNQPIIIEAKASWLVCKEICVPETALFKFPLYFSYAGVKNSNAKIINNVKDELLAIPSILLKFEKSGKNIQLNIPNVNDAVKTAYFFPSHLDQVSMSEQVFDQTKNELSLRLVSAKVNQIDGVLTVFTENNNQFSYKVMANKKSFFFKVIILTGFWAFIGGLLLNIMPCVFPILSLKIFELINKAQSERAVIKKQGLMYFYGVLFSFYCLVLILLGLQALGKTVGWGFQLQSPSFIFVMISLLFLVGLNLSDVFRLPNWLFSIPSFLGGASSRVTTFKPTTRSFFTGVLAVLVATPCTAPFMAPAIGYALTQSVWVNIVIFTAMAIGFAGPFLVISFFPILSKWLPKPGPWMETAKKVLAIPMYLTVFWLIWVIHQQVGAAGVVISCLTILFLIFYCWAQNRSKLFKIVTGLGLGIFFCSCLIVLNRSKINYPTMQKINTVSEIKHLVNAKQKVFVDVTASWCLTCKINEKTVLFTQEIQDYFKEKDITFITLDWTSEDDSITSFLKTFKRQGVPLYVYYNERGEATVLPQLLTKNIIYQQCDE